MKHEFIYVNGKLVNVIDANVEIQSGIKAWVGVVAIIIAQIINVLLFPASHPAWPLLIILAGITLTRGWINNFEITTELVVEGSIIAVLLPIVLCTGNTMIFYIVGLTAISCTIMFIMGAMR